MAGVGQGSLEPAATVLSVAPPPGSVSPLFKAEGF